MVGGGKGTHKVHTRPSKLAEVRVIFGNRNRHTLRSEKYKIIIIITLF